MTVKRVVRRSDTVSGNLMTISKPKFITLTARPANQRPFQVVRSDNGENMTTKAKATRVMRTKRNDNPVLKLTFPEGYDEAQVTASLAEFGMDGYTVEKEGNTFVAIRSDLQSIANPTTDIKLNADGVIASVDAAQYAVKNAVRSDNIALVGIEFDVKRFDDSGVQAWLSQNGVDINQVSVENSGNEAITVKRSEVAEGTDTRRIELEDGVVAVIARSDVTDIPDGFVEVVSEAAYGSWGWGQLDFNASFADRQFSQVMEDAIYRLRDVLMNIILYSPLPLDARKELVNRSLGQFGEFTGNVIDALPRQVLLLVARSEAVSKQEKSEMQTTQQASTGAAPAAASAATPAQNDTVTVSRSELATMIKDAVAAAVPAAATAEAAPANVVRSEAAPTEAAAAAAQAGAAAAQGEAAPAASGTVNISRSDLEALLDSKLAPVVASVAEVKNMAASTVVVRSDGGDGTQVKTENVKRSVFKGAIPGLPNRS